MTSPVQLVIADDDANMRALVRATLQDDYEDVVEVGDGRELFWRLVRASFARRGEELRRLVVITDVRMPGYDGLDVLDAWQDGPSDVPTIVITSFPDDAVRARVEQLGAVLLPKPFTRATLRAVVDEAVKRTSNEE